MFSATLKYQAGLGVDADAKEGSTPDLSSRVIESDFVLPDPGAALLNFLGDDGESQGEPIIGK